MNPDCSRLAAAHTVDFNNRTVRYARARLLVPVLPSTHQPTLRATTYAVPPGLYDFQYTRWETIRLRQVRVRASRAIIRFAITRWRGGSSTCGLIKFSRVHPTPAAADVASGTAANVRVWHVIFSRPNSVSLHAKLCTVLYNFPIPTVPVTGDYYVPSHNDRAKLCTTPCQALILTGVPNSDVVVQSLAPHGSLLD